MTLDEPTCWTDTFFLYIFRIRFLNAMETSQRVVKEIVDRDKRQISELLSSVEFLMEKLNGSYLMMKNYSQLAREYKAPNIISQKHNSCKWPQTTKCVWYENRCVNHGMGGMDSCQWSHH